MDLSTIFCPPLLFSVHFSVHLNGHEKQMLGDLMSDRAFVGQFIV